MLHKSIIIPTFQANERLTPLHPRLAYFLIDRNVFGPFAENKLEDAAGFLPLSPLHN